MITMQRERFGPYVAVWTLRDGLVLHVQVELDDVLKHLSKGWRWTRAGRC